MRKVLRVARERDSQAAEWLEVIDIFDQLISDRAPLEQLAGAATGLTESRVGVDDAWNGRRLVAPRGEAEEARLDQAILEAIVSERIRGRRASLLKVDGHEVVAASVEIGAGRIGAVWLSGRERRRWRPLDHLVVERLSTAVALDALQVRSQEDAKSRVDPAAIERLLSGVADDHESTRLAKQAQLPVSRTYVAVAIGEQPRAAASPEAVASIAARALTAVGLTTRQSVIGRTPAVLCESGVRLGEAIDALAGGAEERGFGLEIGVGQPGPLEHVARSWRQAREALALRSLIADAGPAVYFEQLGILHLLAQIPRTELAAMEDFQRLTALDVDREGASDLDLLDEFLDSGSLRKTAAKMYMHHTTVEYRLRRIQRELGYSLSEPANRTRTKLVITLLRIHRVLGP